MVATEVFNFTEHPFPHVVMDDFIPAELVRDINAEWPKEGWNPYHHKHSQKRAIFSLDHMGPVARYVIQTLNAPDFVAKLGEEAGIPDLSPDPDLNGGGLHETLNGGFLDIHADFNIHPTTRLYRRLNLLLFLNEEWRDEWGGYLELWDRNKHRAQVIAPIAGRAVIFATTDTSFHGHPEPLQCPEGVTRRSIALYYYSPESPEPNPREHSTLYLGEEDSWFRTA